MKQIVAILLAVVTACSLYAASPAKKAASLQKKILLLGNNPYQKQLLNKKYAKGNLVFVDGGKIMTGQAQWYDNGCVFPTEEALKKDKIDAVYIFSSITKNTLPAMKKYVENGGIVLLGYTTLDQCFERDRAMTTAISGIKKTKALHDVPYTQKVALTHTVSYLPVMGKKCTFQQKTVYAVFASDPGEATPLMINETKKDLFAAAYHSYGKGYVIFCGLDNAEKSADLLEFIFKKNSERK